MNPRRAAYDVLHGLETGPSHLDRLLDKALEGGGQAVQARDRAFATSLVYSVLRHRARLDHDLSKRLSRPLAELDLPVLTVLRLGAAELRVLGKSPHAAVHAAVSLAKSTPARRGQGLINAVLRKVAASDEAPPPRLESDPEGHLAVTFSHPLWLVRQLVARHGAEFTGLWLAANQEQPPLTLRVNTLRCTVDELAHDLQRAGCRAEPHPLSPHGLVVSGAGGPLESLPGFGQGLWQTQDAAAQAVGALLGARPGMRVLDLCAGAGGKTGLLAQCMDNQGEIVAVDTSTGRLRAAERNMRRLGVDIVRTMQADGAALPGDLGLFDRILVDAPCTGLGVLGRRPDIRWRRGPGDPDQMAGVQLPLLRRAAGLLAPGGALIYTTCTVTTQENEDVLAALLGEAPELSVEWDDPPPALAVCLGPDGCFRTYPHLHRADAFFAARLVRAR